MKAIVGITSHKLRSENMEHSYVDVCSPNTDKMNITGIQLQRIIDSLLKEAIKMHKEGDTGDLKITFNIRVKAEEIDKALNIKHIPYK